MQFTENTKQPSLNMKSCCGNNEYVPPVIRNEHQAEMRHQKIPRGRVMRENLAKAAPLLTPRGSIREEIENALPAHRFEAVCSMVSQNAKRAGGGTIKATLRYKPVEIKAVHVEAVHFASENDQSPRNLRESAWVVEGPDGKPAYITEEQLMKFFEIVEEEEGE